MNVYQRRRILKLLRARIKPSCSFSEIINRMISPSSSRNSYVSGRSMDDCEIHIDGNMFFWIAGVAGAGLAFLTYQAITMAGRRKKREDQDQFSDFQKLSDMIWLGIKIFSQFMLVLCSWKGSLIHQVHLICVLLYLIHLTLELRLMFSHFFCILLCSVCLCGNVVAVFC